jgi:F-type H+-transporting ATPase subunit a
MARALDSKGLRVAAEGKIDPMHQFTVERIGPKLDLFGYDISFTNSALWMLITLLVLGFFMIGGMKRQLVPGRWQVAVEGMTGFIRTMVDSNIGPEGRAFAPYLFSLFMFILVSNLLGMLPLAIVPGYHAFTTTSHFSITGLLAVMSFSIVIIVGLWRNGFHFFKLFWAPGTHWAMALLLVPIEVVSFMVRPFSLLLRLFVAMMSGHILMEVFGSFIVSGFGSGSPLGFGVGIVSFAFIVGVGALELLICALQAYVFALLTSLYLHDAIHLH